jgi:hypothetical protein
MPDVAMKMGQAKGQGKSLDSASPGKVERIRRTNLRHMTRRSGAGIIGAWKIEPMSFCNATGSMRA